MPDEINEYEILSSLGSCAFGKTYRVKKGCKVRVQYQRVGAAEKNSKREAVSRVIAKALRRLEGKS